MLNLIIIVLVRVQVLALVQMQMLVFFFSYWLPATAGVILYFPVLSRSGMYDSASVSVAESGSRTVHCSAVVTKNVHHKKNIFLSTIFVK